MNWLTICGQDKTDFQWLLSITSTLVALLVPISGFCSEAIGLGQLNTARDAHNAQLVRSLKDEEYGVGHSNFDQFPQWERIITHMTAAKPSIHDTHGEAAAKGAEERVSKDEDVQAKLVQKQIRWQLLYPGAFGSKTTVLTTPSLTTPDTVQSLNQMPPPADSKADDTCHQEAACTADDWQAMLYAARALPPKSQLEIVNSWANKIRYVEDVSNWAMADYWQITEEFIARGGDCEDYAITKYFGLKQLGFSTGDMRILVLFDLQLRLHHAVLLVRLDGEVLMLDNQKSSVVPFFDAAHYQPIYSLNEQNWWMHKTLNPVRLTVARPAHLSARRTNAMRRFR